MKKYLTILTIGLLFPLLAFARGSITYSDAPDYLKTVGTRSGTFSTEGGDIFGYIGTGVQAALGLVGIIFFILIVYAGFKWFTSRGEEAAVTSARNTVIAASIGLVVILASYGLTSIVQNQFILGQEGGPNVTGNTAGTGTNAGRIGCCMDATNDTPLGFIYTAYLTDSDTCETRQSDDNVSGAKGVYWDWFSQIQLLDTCNDLMRACYNNSELFGDYEQNPAALSSCASDFIKNL